MICVSLYSISLVIIGRRLEHEWKVDSNQLFFNFLSMSTQLWAALININSYQLNCEMLLSISMSTSIVPILAYQLFLINALNISVLKSLPNLNIAVWDFGESQRLQCAWEGHSEITHLVFSFLSRLFGVQMSNNVTSSTYRGSCIFYAENQTSITSDS